MFRENIYHCQDCVCLVNSPTSELYCDEAGKNISDIDKCPEGCFDRSNETEFIVPVSFEMCGLIKVMAGSAAEALDKVLRDYGDYPLPEDATYVDGSFTASCNEEEIVEYYTDKYKKGEIEV